MVGMTPPKGKKADKSTKKLTNATKSLPPKTETQHESASLEVDMPPIGDSHAFKKEVEILKAYFNSKISDLKLEVTDLKQEVLEKNKAIDKLKHDVVDLKSEVSDLKKGYNFISQETSDIKESISDSEQNVTKSIKQLAEKSNDLEDRSRRNNLVFFGIPELSDKQTTEDCDRLVTKILASKNILSLGDNDIVFDRAHRLGPKKPDQTRPRPIIVRATFYKDKVHILENANRFRDTPYSVAEDFSKETLGIRRQLVAQAKTAKLKCSGIKYFKLKYKTLVLTYENPDTEKTFYKSFNIHDVLNNTYWYMPNARNQHRQNS